MDEEGRTDDDMTKDLQTLLGSQAGGTIAYDDVEKLREVLVGQRVVAITETTGSALKRENKDALLNYSYDGRGPYDRVLEYHLSSGLVLRAHAHDGGCACANGCFSVDIGDEDRERLIGATIMGVTSRETLGNHRYWDAQRHEYVDREPTVIVDGQGEGIHRESATIEVFVYTELAETALVRSEGSDNGYYGWGFHWSLEHPVLVVPEGFKSGELDAGLES